MVLLRSVLVFALGPVAVSSFSQSQPRANLPDLYEATLADLQAGLEAGQFTSVDLVTAYIARINEVNSELHAVIEISPTALTQAAALDAQRKQNQTLGPLHGIPILVKDNIATQVSDGMNTTAGSYVLLNSVVPGDSTVVAKLRAAGAIILGKANMSEWAGFGPLAPAGWSGRGGLTTNAYYPKGTACGSSSGSGVAASIGLSAAALGTETAGSITCPASANNVVGIKPTVGLTSRAGVIPASEHQDTVGPLARTVTDAALILNVIAGKDSADNYTSAQPSTVPDYTARLSKDALKGVRIGVPREVFLDPAYGPIVGAPEFATALKTLESLGAIITDPANVTTAAEALLSPIPGTVLNTDIKYDLESYLATLTSIPTNVHTVQDIAAWNDANKALEEPALDAYTEWNLYFDLAATTSRDANYTAAVATDYSWGRTQGIDAALTKYNLSALVLPETSAMTVVAGIAGYPIVTVPLGFQANTTKPLDAGGADQPYQTAPNLPFGLTFVGTAWSEADLIAYAYAYEQATMTRLKLKAYEAATPKTQLVDVIGKDGNSTSTASSTASSTTSTTSSALRARSVAAGFVLAAVLSAWTMLLEFVV
ncbi:Amidase domain-containing protein [Mycena chlorophos]|uniref:Amidase domain-containing protein n=1 Tax=Mycena chlorophos TaxID=658473 RepID=A0A8H6WGJ7_MYCCL|nr:Amidase domain-containing protein [Mycena chlorophos]